MLTERDIFEYAVAVIGFLLTVLSKFVHDAYTKVNSMDTKYATKEELGSLNGRMDLFFDELKSSEERHHSEMQSIVKEFRQSQDDLRKELQVSQEGIRNYVSGEIGRNTDRIMSVILMDRGKPSHDQ